MLNARGVTVRGEENRLAVRTPPGMLTPGDRADLAEAKPALLAHLSREAEELARVEGLLAGPRARRAAAGIAARANVLAVYGDLARKYAERHDPLLFQAAGAVEALFGRWEEER